MNNQRKNGEIRKKKGLTKGEKPGTEGDDSHKLLTKFETKNCKKKRREGGRIGSGKGCQVSKKPPGKWGGYPGHGRKKGVKLL